ncbi:hypothetical protein [Thalassomonas sp. RHCl1]|uniref:hypothetical protein n=1 Tax=Thalassomonas sp. RHCl1 TaxID=2995320 RepID=UPI00248B8E85|nr:hypothetical protein [Thalassomonas sp. RHCl1]
MKTILLLCFYLFSCWVSADEINQTLPGLDLGKAFNRKVSFKTKEVDQSFNIINEYIEKNYGNKSNFFCGGPTNLTPDEELKFNYNYGFVKVVSSFSSTQDIISFTPIRQIVNNPERKAVFKGYYFVSR